MKKILIIEDNLDLRENIQALLEKEDFLVSNAISGEAALDLFVKMKPDLILCDILLPEMSGYSVLKKIRKIKNNILPVFIFITAKTQKGDIRQGMNLGADDYITKPFSKEELLDSIHAQLQKRENAIIHFGKNSTSATTTEKHSKLNKSLPQIFHPNSDYEEYLFLKNKKESGFFLIDNIIVIKSLRDYSQLLLKGNKTFIIRHTMTDWEKKLPHHKFVRIHKQTLVNIKFIENIEMMSSNRFRITLIDMEKQFEVSQRYSRKMRHMFE